MKGPNNIKTINMRDNSTKIIQKDMPTIFNKIGNRMLGYMREHNLFVLYATDRDISATHLEGELLEQYEPNELGESLDTLAYEIGFKVEELNQFSLLMMEAKLANFADSCGKELTKLLKAQKDIIQLNQDSGEYDKVLIPAFTSTLIEEIYKYQENLANTISEYKNLKVV